MDRGFLSSFLNVFTFTSDGHDVLTIPEMNIIPVGSGMSVSAAFGEGSPYKACLFSYCKTNRRSSN